MEKVTIRLAKSLIGRGKEQIAVAHSLGLNRPGEVTEQPCGHLRARSVHEASCLHLLALCLVHNNQVGDLSDLTLGSCVVRLLGNLTGAVQAQ